MAILVTGATGNVGGRVVDQLLQRGVRPRVFARSAERARARFGDRVDLALGDLADAASLTPALAGVEELFLVNGEGPDLSRRDAVAAAAAKAANVRHVVKLSALSAALPAGATSALGSWHAEGERAVRSAGVAWTIVQPTGFMSNALAWAPSIKATGAVRAPTGEGRIAMVHPDDIAAVVVEALLGSCDGQTLPLTGPEALTYGQMTSLIGAAIGKPLVFQAISDEQARQRLLGNGMPAPLAEGLIELWRSVREGQVAMVTDTVQRVTGRKPVAFARWAEANAVAFS